MNATINKGTIAKLFMFSLAFSGLVHANTEGFPGRTEFPEIPIIELQDLHAQYNDVLIVDARSSYEFDTLRIKGAQNLPVASANFEKDLAALARQTSKPIVFYCNGRTCFKSYLAVKKGLKAGVKNLIAFDAGIFEWAKSFPEKAELLGSSPVDPNRLISKKKLKAHFLSPEVFSNQIVESGTKAMVLDVRDKYQRAGIGFYPGKERWSSLDDQKKLLKYLSKAKSKKQTLFIYDEVGKQVRWLQYALEKHGIKDYYFMEKGATGYYAKLNQIN